jgi:DNA modification methylase
LIFSTDNTTTLHLGDAHDVLAAMPNRSADCIVTSPPYWAKRDYGMPGQYGLEASPAAYVETLRSVFREAWRVLADDGTCWLNLGDCYSEGRTTPAGLHGYPGFGLITGRGPAVAAKNLLGLPWRIAFALQDDGWILRNAIVWHKPNAMPQSVRDRMSNRYELIFLLAKSRHYWFDLDPIRLPHARHTPASPCTASTGQSGSSRPGGIPATGRHPGNGKTSGTHPGSAMPGGTRPGNRRPKYSAHTRQVIGAHRYPDGRCHPNGRNPGDVWAVPTRPFRGSHFAAFPIDLPTRCIKAGCKPGGTVLDPFCGTGTTGLAALALGRRFTGIELNPAFAALAAERLRHAAEHGTGNDAE